MTKTNSGPLNRLKTIEKAISIYPYFEALGVLEKEFGKLTPDDYIYIGYVMGLRETLNKKFLFAYILNLN